MSSSRTRIDVRTLQNGIEASQAARHGRGAGALQHCHIEALLALDGHPSLGVMGRLVNICCPFNTAIL
ncbi:hypothetical protein [Streptomyces sp. NPDC040750]|uniref:hypothetical protein n=1 Tax=Streptomyces sp. NPDC040750 TaxID=3154491 RepID=UPI0033F74EB3